MAGLIKGRVNEIEDLVRRYFAGNPGMEYSIHITRWKRDASGYILRYIDDASEIVRVYAFGGGGTLFEVINGTVGLPNAQVAWYPLGRDNNLLAVFDKHEQGSFQSLKTLTLSPVITIDTILAGSHYVTSNVLIGIEAAAYRDGKALSAQFLLSRKLCFYIMSLFRAFLRPEIQHYRIITESTKLEGDLLGIMVSNISTHGSAKPAPNAQFDDGYMDLYTLKPAPKRKMLKMIMDYFEGRYDKWPDYIRHYRCKNIRVTSSAGMSICMDGELFYDTELNLEIQPSSLDFVCPPGISKAFFSLKPLLDSAGPADLVDPPESTVPLEKSGLSAASEVIF
jgi:diacylglycerol kinase family enzyme